MVDVRGRHHTRNSQTGPAAPQKMLGPAQPTVLQQRPAHCSAAERGPGKPAPIGDAAGDCRHCLRLRPEEREKAWGSGSDGPNAGDGAGEAAVLPTVTHAPHGETVLPTVAHAPHAVGTGEMVTNASFLCTAEGREEV